jgi:hypothetical protein
MAAAPKEAAMVRGWLAAGGVLLALMATPAAACRVGGDDLIFDLAPVTPEGERFATVAKVRLEGEHPGSAFRPELWEQPRGFPVGTARVLEVVRGPALPAEIPVYLEVLTSCSNFFRKPADRSSPAATSWAA